MSYEVAPPLASMLLSREIPSTGGSTWFCDMAAACAALPPALRTRLEGMRVKHDGTYNSGGYLRKGVEATDNPIAAPGRLHPAIVRIPESGHAALYLGRRRMAYFAGLSRDECEKFLDDVWRYDLVQWARVVKQAGIKAE